MEARSICGAALDQQRVRGEVKNKAIGKRCREYDHGILEAGCSGGALRSILAVSMDDACIGRLWALKKYQSLERIV